jgi:uncharacterized membrane protein
MKKRLRNYGLWVAVASFVLLVLQTFGVEIASEKYYELVNAALGILILLGIISNPTRPDSKGFNL